MAYSADAEQAWLELVDRLLASPHYGEQAARHWLDVVRYADSGGFANDWQRPNAWRYRDYVVRAFNQDKPYNQFVLEQIAGDELNSHDPEMKIAVGFLRMGPWEHSFMSVPKVSRQQYLDDVTDAVGQVFLAQPMQCARCHDHKFDPIPTRDFYAMQAVFATTQLADVEADWLPEENRKGMQADRLVHERKRAWNETQVTQIEQKIVDKEKAWFRQRKLSYTSRDQAIRLGLPPAQVPEYRVGLTPDDLGADRVRHKWQDRYRWEKIRYEPKALSVYNGKTRLSKGVNKPTQVPADPLGKGTLQTTAILTGGDPFSPGEKVPPGVLSVCSGNSRKITQQPSGRRLALANWLADPSNPLPARVMANRIWQSHFGRGIVGTPNNFGARGKKPTHPALLDYLATSFVEYDWSMKKLHRLILTSAAYRRAGQHPRPSTLKTIDPEEKLYAIYRPRRLAAEELRDAMLSVSGELNLTLGGIPARPDMNLEAALQPRLIMGTFAPAYVPHATPAQRNRRTIYALKLRGLRDPFLELFNQPTPDTSCELRDQSNVTPQVFSLLNSQESADRSLALAKRLLENSLEDALAIKQLFWLVYGRQPSTAEADSALEHWQQMQTIQEQVMHQPAEYPTRVVRRANDENSGQVFEFTERLFGYENYVPDLQPHEVDARTRGLADVCLMLLNSNEFCLRVLNFDSRYCRKHNPTEKFFLMQRRDFLYSLGASIGSVALSSQLASDRARAAIAPRPIHFPTAKAKQCIFLYMEGGPSHIDTFDPKPALDKLHMREFRRTDEHQSAMSGGNRYYVKSPFSFRKAGESGADMNTLWKQLAGVADDLCFYRGLQVDSVDHPTANYQLNTGNRFWRRPLFGVVGQLRPGQ